ncbi:MAG: UDP-N-acetylmuramate:L-alanyl-gamma-D-glutamyl-meso-diaminopimelate ligase [Deltaproteobacteria bacterium]|nr:UDP-N-acetylmuramate:L-alanyl-gamma-D-glutamyl-meso-diaminopimelate ligase [Deltaproteobacteria bacterium]
MDLSKNRIPEHVKKIHLIAVCGTGMGALASMLKDMGFEVTGSDRKIYPPMSSFLAQKGIKIADGFDEKNISSDTDLVVVGNAVSKDNIEVIETDKMGLYFCSMPQALNRFIAAEKKPIIITGTHGKTTTSSILAWILYKARLDPTFMIGGLLKNFDSNYRLGNGLHIIIEGDEYDTAFFDKGPKFLHYDPYIAVLTSVEFDHADIFKDMNHVKKTFDRFISSIAQKSTLVAFDGDKNVEELIRDKKCRVERYGQDMDSTWRIRNISIDSPWTSFEILKQKRIFGTFKTNLIGRHNLLNILSTIAVADRLNIPCEVIAGAVETFEGIKRRQEVRGIKRGITVMDDFAHHPTAVKETISAARPFYTKGRIIAVFEPRTNSSMRKVFQNIYPGSFDSADLICIRKPPLLEKIPHAERFSSEKLVDDLKNQGKEAYFFPNTEAIIDFLVDRAKPGDLILIMSNGGFDNIHERLLERL